jgi:ubiquinone/menaquinone biosynthesis C-methylase UbiE
MVSHPHLELQLDWDQSKLEAGWVSGPDTAFVMERLADVPVDVTAAGRPARVLEVAAAEAVHACKLSLRGIETVVVEPSTVMLARARERMVACGAHLTLIRGVAETLPFPDQTFDRVLIDSAIDHLAEPELSIREMTRVLKPDGRLVISFVNYQSLSTRISRLLYRGARRVGFTSRSQVLFWDTPVPIEHTFECTYDVLQQMCRPYLELDQVHGVSLGWMTPGWASLLQRLPRARGRALLQRLDAFARRRPRLADFVVSSWRPRSAVPPAAAPRTRGPSTRDLVYPSRLRAEAKFWERIELGAGFFERTRGVAERFVNEAYTGDASRSWLDDLVSRGPFDQAASLGCDEGGYEREWLNKGGSRTLDVYELSPVIMRDVRRGLGRALRRRARFHQVDLNFARLPRDRYDVVWSSGCLHHIIELEHLFDEVARALRPGGLFAICDYVGEVRMRITPARLDRINAVLRSVPARFRFAEHLSVPAIEGLSPFCGVRSDAIVELAKARFDVLHAATTGALFPLNFAIDLAAVEREAPEVLQQLQAAESAARQEPGIRPCGAYLVLRKR